MALDLEQLRDVERRSVPRVGGGRRGGEVSHPSAGMIVEVIDVRVRSLVFTNCMASCSNAGSAARRSSTGTSRPASSGSATQPSTSRIRLSPSAAACNRAARTRRAWASQNSRSPDPAFAVAAIMSVARSVATTGSAHPVSGSNVIVDPRSARPTALNTNTGPRRPRSGPHSSYRSVRVEVTRTAPGASSTRPASHCVFPVRGPPNTIVTSSTDDHACSSPTRHSRTATSTTGSRHHRHRDNSLQRRADDPGAALHRRPGRHPQRRRGSRRPRPCAATGCPTW